MPADSGATGAAPRFRDEAKLAAGDREYLVFQRHEHLAVALARRGLALSVDADGAGGSGTVQVQTRAAGAAETAVVRAATDFVLADGEGSLSASEQEALQKANEAQELA